MTATYGYVATTINWDVTGGVGFNNTAPSHLVRQTLSLLVEKHLADRWHVQLGLGAPFQGSLVYSGQTFDLLPALAVNVGASFRALDGRGHLPFVLLAASVAASFGWTVVHDVPESRPDPLFAFDGRVSVTVGKTFARAVTPYVSFRYFDFPLVWRYQGSYIYGADAFLYQGAAGLAVTLGKWLVMLDVSPLGERSATFGIGTSL